MEQNVCRFPNFKRKKVVANWLLAPLQLFAHLSLNWSTSLAVDGWMVSYFCCCLGICFLIATITGWEKMMEASRENNQIVPDIEKYLYSSGYLSWANINILLYSIIISRKWQQKGEISISSQQQEQRSWITMTFDTFSWIPGCMPVWVTGCGGSGCVWQSLFFFRKHN